MGSHPFDPSVAHVVRRRDRRRDARLVHLLVVQDQNLVAVLERLLKPLITGCSLAADVEQLLLLLLTEGCSQSFAILAIVLVRCACGLSAEVPRRPWGGVLDRLPARQSLAAPQA